MKGILIALGIKATLIYVNGPANSPILNRMAISVISLKNSSPQPETENVSYLDNS